MKQRTRRRLAARAGSNRSGHALRVWDLLSPSARDWHDAMTASEEAMGFPLIRGELGRVDAGITIVEPDGTRVNVT